MVKQLNARTRELAVRLGAAAMKVAHDPFYWVILPTIAYFLILGWGSYFVWDNVAMTMAAGMCFLFLAGWGGIHWVDARF